MPRDREIGGAMRHVLFLLMSASLMFFGCGKKADERKVPEVKAPSYDNSLPGEEGMKNAIRGYNQAIIDAHLSDLHIKFMAKYATDKEAQRVFVFINTDREKGWAMAMKLNKLTFDNISTSEKVNLVDTSENWDFQYLDIKTSKPIEPVKEMRYRLRYFLVKDGGKWFVAKLKEREKTLIGEYTPPRWSLTGE